MAKGMLIWITHTALASIHVIINAPCLSPTGQGIVSKDLIKRELLEIIKLPGACVCRPVIQGDYLYAAVFRSPNSNAPGRGFVTILDKHDKVVSNIGGNEPIYLNGILQPLRQTEKIFVHPHDVCVDQDENIYVAQWASVNVYPYKLTRA